MLALAACAQNEGDSEGEDLGVVHQMLSVDAGASILIVRPGGGATGDDDSAGPGGVGIATRDGGALDGGFPFPPFLDAGGPDLGPLASWQFDDCSARATTLLDSTPHGLNAQRTASVACTDGIVGQAVAIDERRDLVEAPAATAFALSSGKFTIAAWVNPRSAASGSIANKQSFAGSVFELALERGSVVLTAAVQSGHRVQHVSSRAPLPAGKWSHVAGVYDGEFLRLFRAGELVGLVDVAGTLIDTSAPIRIGNNLRGQFLSGKVDQVALWNRALKDSEVAALSCIHQPPLLAVTPASSGPVDADTLVNFDIAYTDRDIGGCSPADVILERPFPVPDGFSVNVPTNFLELNPGETAHFTLAVTGTTDADPGTHEIPFQMFDFNAGDVLNGQVEYILNAPTGCFVRTGRELLMRDLSVVEDPIRTTFEGPADDPRTGAWTFGRLLEQLAPTPEQAPAMVEQLFKTWLSDQTVNSFSVPARTAMQQAVLDNWPRTASGALDLQRAPLRLLAIVNRIDIRNLAQKDAGEGRFVFGVLQSVAGFDNPLEFTVILEYRLPATTTDDVIAWGNRWHALASQPFPSEEYNAALQALTDSFAGRGAEPDRPNGSALGQLRTNEIALANRWELREFQLSAATGMFVPVTVKLTPDTGFIDESDLVARYVNENEADILIERHTVPELFEGVPFLGGSSFNDLVAWRSSGITNPEARHKFSLNTCNGCHSSEETGTGFLHISPRGLGSIAQVSGFMSGITVLDPVTGEQRTFNDLSRRNADLKAIVCGGVAPTVTTAPSTSTATPAARAAVRVSAGTREAFLSRGIGRVH